MTGRKTFSGKLLSLAPSFANYELPPILLKLDFSTILNDKVCSKLPGFSRSSILTADLNTSLLYCLVDQETIARLAEADLVTQDLERANSRVAEVERRNEKLRSEVEAVRSGSESTARLSSTPFLSPISLLLQGTDAPFFFLSVFSMIIKELRH